MPLGGSEDIDNLLQSKSHEIASSNDKVKSNEESDVIPVVEEVYSPSNLANILCSPPDTRMDICTRIFPSLCISPILLPPFPNEEMPPGIKPFKFDQPSPDDIVLERQTIPQRKRMIISQYVSYIYLHCFFLQLMKRKRNQRK